MTPAQDPTPFPLPSNRDSERNVCASSPLPIHEVDRIPSHRSTPKPQPAQYVSAVSKARECPREYFISNMQLGDSSMGDNPSPPGTLEGRFQKFRFVKRKDSPSTYPVNIVEANENIPSPPRNKLENLRTTGSFWGYEVNSSVVEGSKIGLSDRGRGKWESCFLSIGVFVVGSGSNLLKGGGEGGLGLSGFGCRFQPMRRSLRIGIGIWIWVSFPAYEAE